MLYDAAVVGAGLAGLQCARLLAQRGLRVALLDRKATLTEGIHTTGIFVRKSWEDFPLPDEQLGPGIRRVVLYPPSRRPIELTAAHDEFRVGRMEWIYLYLLEQCGRSGVRWMPGTHLLAAEPSADRSILTVQHNGKRSSLAARFVVGADGPRSRVAQQFGLDRNHELLAGVEEVLPSRGGPAAMHCYLDPRLAPGYIAWLVDDGVESHLGLAGYGHRFQPVEALQAFRRSLDSPFPPPLERRGGLIPVNGVLHHLANRHALLVGDAAGAVSPLTAGGLDGALRLSSFAAEVIDRYLQTGDQRVLRQYRGERFRARFLARRWMRRAMRAVEHPLIVELGCELLRRTPLMALARHVFFGRGSFPDIALPAAPVSAETL